MRDGVEHPTSFIEASRKKEKLEKLSNNISERLTRKKPVSERSERGSEYNVGFATGLSASES